MKALSILQPWAWLIVRPDIVGEQPRLEAARNWKIKDVENRTWWTSWRGRFLVHTGKNYSLAKHHEYADAIHDMFRIELPAYERLPRGGIVGDVELFDICRTESPWAVEGQHHWRLRRARPRPFVPMLGQRGLFEISEAELAAAEKQLTEFHLDPG